MLEQRDYGDATRKKMRIIYDTRLDALRLELAAMLDMRILVQTTYELEGDRLEVLLTFDRIESLRAIGRSIAGRDDGILPNVDAVLRSLIELKKDVTVEKHFDGYGKVIGTLDKKEDINSSLYPGKVCAAWLVKYADGHTEHFEEEELRSGKEGPVPNGEDGKAVLVIRGLPERNQIFDALSAGFTYLENRITGNCDAPYSLVGMYELCRVARAFDPNFAAAHLTSAFVDSMSAITPLAAHGMLPGLKQALPLYLVAAATAPVFNKASVSDYSTVVLKWHRGM